jgi:hypothetical protein
LRYCSISAVELNFFRSGDADGEVAGMPVHPVARIAARMRREPAMRR